MKKLLLFIPAVLLFFSSCVEGDTIYEGARVSTQYITVYPKDWIRNPIYSQNEGYAFASYNMSQITPQIIDRGAVMCYLVGNYDNALPFIMSTVDDDGFVYTNTISFEVAPGKIRFISENSDLLISYPSSSMQIKVVTIQNP